MRERAGAITADTARGSSYSTAAGADGEQHQRPFVGIGEAAEMLGISEKTLARRLGGTDFPLEVIRGLTAHPVLRRRDIVRLIEGENAVA